MVPKENKITTIKLSQITKERLEKLRSYKRESYEEILQKLLEVLSICRVNPLKARARLVSLDKLSRRRIQKTAKQA